MTCKRLIVLTLLATTAYPSAPAATTAAATTSAAAAAITQQPAASAVVAITDIPAHPEEASIKFDRENVNEMHNSQYLALTKTCKWVEGFWRDDRDPQEIVLDYNKNYPFPQSHNTAFPGKEAFLDKLAVIEGLAKEFSEEGIAVYGTNGPSESRLEPGKYVGRATFYDHDYLIAWPEKFGTYYVGKHNVVPSRQFFRYVHHRAKSMGDSIF